MDPAVKEQRFAMFVKGLDFRKRAALALLGPEKTEKLKSLPEDCWETGLLVMDMNNRQSNGRECWVNGIEHMEKFVSNPDHFIDLIRRADLRGLDDMVALILETRSGKLDYLKNHDKRLMNLLKTGTDTFFRLQLDRVDYPGLVFRIQEMERTE